MIAGDDSDRSRDTGSWRLFRFRLLTLLLLVAFVAVICGLHANRIHRTSMERAIGAAIMKEGGFFNRNDQMDGDWKPLAKPWFPPWLERLVGRDYLTSIDAVVFVSHKDVDSILPTVAGLSELRLLKLPACHVTDEGLSSLNGVARLRWLELVATPVTDEGLRQVAKIQSIEVLDLRGTGVTDEGVESLRSMPRLKRVLLHGTKVTSDRVGRLREELPKCEIDTATKF